MYLKSTIVLHSPCFLWKATLICTWRVTLYCTHLASCGKPPWYVHEEYRCTIVTLLPVESHPDMYMKSTVVLHSPCFLWKATLICTWRVPLYCTHLAPCGKPPWYVPEEYRCTILTLLSVESAATESWRLGTLIITHPGLVIFAFRNLQTLELQ